MDPPKQDEIEKRKVKFGERERHKTLVLDLDETLIHSIFNPNDDAKLDSDFMIKLDQMEICVLIRPHMKEVLEKLSNLYEICVFTAGT